MKKLQLLHMTSAALLLASCTQSGPEESYGYIYANVGQDLDVSVVSKAEVPEDMLFSLDIYKGEELVSEVEDYTSLFDNPLMIKTGNYTVVASSGDNAAASFDAPFYSGSAECTIMPDRVTSVDITASLANVKVTSAFDESITSNFRTYSLTVSNGAEGGSLVFGSTEGTADRTGYLSVTGSLEWVLSLTNVEGTTYTASGSYSDVQAKQHYAFSFRLEDYNPDEEFGAASVIVIVNESMTEKEYDLVLDFNAAMPQITSDNMDITGESIQIPAGDASSRTLDFSVADGFSSIVLSTSDPALLSAGLPQETELIGASAETLALLSSLGISVPSVAEGAAEVAVDMSGFISGLAVGTYSVDFSCRSVKNTYAAKSLVFDMLLNVEAEAVSVNPWAMFATLKGKWHTQSMPEGLSFQYRKASEEVWTDFTGAVVPEESSSTFTAELRGLDPDTDYEFRAVSAADISEGKESTVIPFRTESAATLHNMGFDFWWQSGDAPMPNESSAYAVWDTANPGSAGYGMVPTNPESSYLAVEGEGKQAAKLESKFLEKYIITLNIFAAGNIYTGKFVKAVVDLSNPGAELDWGVPFASRPLALTGYYDYRPKTIDKAKDPYTGMLGQTDIGQVQVILTDWDAPFRINTQSKTFVDVDNDPHIIAYGTMDFNETASYEKFTVKLGYRDTTRTPKYIVVVASASKYGDYFTGAVGSVLYLDEFSFVYNPDELEQ